MSKVAIVGAGPAGVYCALHLKKLLPEIEIDIFEKNSPLETLLPTGNGRCNITHLGIDIKDFAKNYPRGEKFLYSIFHTHFVPQTLDFFKEIGIKTYMQKDERYFPTSNSAKEVQTKMLKNLKANIIKNYIKDIKELESYDFIVLSTGSKDSWNLARQVGHKIIEPKSALCGLKLSKNSPKYPTGVTLKTKAGDILFTHLGISGPLVYEISSINARKNFPYKITLPLIDYDELTKYVKENPKKAFITAASEFIPKSLAMVLIKENANCANVKKAQIEGLSTIEFEVISTDGKGEIVKCGGVSLKEVTNKCQSKINEKIFFCGEILDIDGFCGGFNLQNCWSTGFCAAMGIYLTLKKNL